MKKNTIKACLCLLFLITLVSFGCKRDRSTIQAANSNSFLPMQVGNLWYTNKQNFTEIQDSILINGQLYYKFYSLIGGDAISTSYMRIDERGKLIASDPKYPKMNIIMADFGAKVGDKFFTTGQGNDTDQEVTVTEKTADQMSFSFDNIYHPNLKGHPYLTSYIKGRGFPGNWTRLRINGVALK